MLQFWVAASNFRQQLMDDSTSLDGLQAQSDAMVLYDKYGFFFIYLFACHWCDVKCLLMHINVTLPS